MKPTIVQHLKKEIKEPLELAILYYRMISELNGLSLTEREIQLIAFTAIKGSVSYTNVKKEFCERYKSSPFTVNNMISKLKRKGIMVMDGRKVKVNSKIVLDFEKNITLQISLCHG